MFVNNKNWRIFAIQIVGFSHLLINLTNLTLDVRKFPRLSDIILFWDDAESLMTLNDNK